MSKTSSQVHHLVDRLQHLQHRIQHGFRTELEEQEQNLSRVRQRFERNSRHWRKQLEHGGQQQRGGGIALTLGLLALGGVAWFVYRSQTSPSTEAVKGAPSVDLNRFAGKWFEIARFPGKHHDVAGMTLTYTLNPDNSLDVVMNYHDHDLNGPEHTEHKHIRIAEPDNRSHLKKQILGPLSTDYWILEIGKDYDYAVLGTPSRKHLWILSRTPHFDEARYEDILDRMAEQGFDTDRLIRVPQDEHAPVALNTHLKGLLDQKRQYFKGQEHNRHLGPHPEKRGHQPEKRGPHPEKREGL